MASVNLVTLTLIFLVLLFYAVFRNVKHLLFCSEILILKKLH